MWSSETSLLKWRFRSCRRRCCLGSLIKNWWRTSRGCTEQNDGHRMISLTSLAWISSNDRILWSIVCRILLWANTQFVQRFSTQSRQRAVAWELSSQLVHLVGFWTASTVSILLMKKLSGNASIPLAGTGTSSWHIEHSRVRSWDLQRIDRHRNRYWLMMFMMITGLWCF